MALDLAVSRHRSLASETLQNGEPFILPGTQNGDCGVRNPAEMKSEAGSCWLQLPWWPSVTCSNPELTWTVLTLGSTLLPRRPPLSFDTPPGSEASPSLFP